MAIGRRYRVDEDNGSYGQWEVYNSKTDNRVKVCQTREAARDLAAKKNMKLK